MGRVEAIEHTRRRLLVLGAGPPQLDLIEAANAQGIWTAVCDRDPAAPGFRFADSRCIVSIEDEPAIERLASALELDGIIAPGRDRSTAAAARIAHKLGIGHPLTPQTAALLAQRLRQREVLAAAGVGQPRWQTASAETSELDLPYPAVVKTVDRSGQTQLRFVEGPGELAGALAAAAEATRAGPLLVEEYLDGPEATVTGFSLAGRYRPLLVSDRSCSAPPVIGIPLSESWPSRHAESVTTAARRAVEALGILDGPSHVRLRIGSGGALVLQVSGRLGANHEAQLIQRVTGVDLEHLALAAALGEEIDESELDAGPQARIPAAMVAFLVAPQGQLDAVELPASLEQVERSWIYREPGHRFGPLRRPSDRAGALLVTGESSEAVARAASAALQRIRFSTADAGTLV